MTIERSSVVAAPPDVVWARIASADGINDEMRPWMSMSPPRGTTLTLETIPVGQPVGRCVLRLFGVVPFDYDDLALTELDPGRGFHESSTMLSMSRWEHDRRLEPVDGGTRVTDRVSFTPRWFLRPLTPVLRLTVGAFFSHRHRRLARHFGSA